MSGFKKGHSSFKRQTLKKQHSPVLKKLAIAFAIVLVAVALYIKVQPYTKEAKLERQLESTSQHLIETKSKLEQTQTQSKAEEAEKVKQIEELNKQIQEKDRQLQAKRSVPKAYAAELPAFVPTGDKQAWLEQSGIPADLWWAVDWLVTRESGWKPCAYNPGQNDCSANPSTACGLVQQFPCHKIPGDWRDPVAALKWQYNYVNARYGGYAQAVAYWKIHGNY